LPKRNTPTTELVYKSGRGTSGKSKSKVSRLPERAPKVEKMRRKRKAEKSAALGSLKRGIAGYDLVARVLERGGGWYRRSKGTPKKGHSCQRVVKGSSSRGKKGSVRKVRGGRKSCNASNTIYYRKETERDRGKIRDRKSGEWESKDQRGLGKT